MYLAMDGVAHRKRTIDMVRSRREHTEQQEELEARKKRVRANPELYTPFNNVPEVASFLQCFQRDAMRFPLLVVHAPSRVGKTEWAKSLFRNPLSLEVGKATEFPETMRQFDRKKHDALVLDDLRNLQFLSDHQDKLQGSYDRLLEFASTTGGTCAFWRDLYRIPVVATVNNDTKNLHWLKAGAHDFLGNSENVHYLHFSGRPGEVAPRTFYCDGS